MTAPNVTTRLRLDLSYDGTDLHGWAKQEGLRTVQGEIETALATIFRSPVTLTVAGRTDAGVHAVGQVAHFDLPASPAPPRTTAPDMEKLQRRINSLLSARYAARWRPLVEKGFLPRSTINKGDCDIIVNSVTPVSTDFDARFSATERSYRYLINDRPQTRNPLFANQQWWPNFASLDVGRMQDCAVLAQGEHDFLSLCRPREGATTIRSLKSLRACRDEDETIAIDVSADAFCHSMVRSLVGAMVEVGRGAKPLTWFQSLIDHPSRSHGVPVAPAKGLTLIRVQYPEPDRWAERARTARQRREPSGTAENFGSSTEESGTISVDL